MHRLSSSFVLGYHGCEAAVAEKLLINKPFEQSTDDYDWLGSGIYFWEANPDRALGWAVETGLRGKRDDEKFHPAVVGAVIDLGYCLDLISSNGIAAVGEAYRDLSDLLIAMRIPMPVNEGGADLLLRRLDCTVVEYLHETRLLKGEPPFDTVRGLFGEDEPLYPNSGFRRKTHVQICVRNPEMIKGVFRVPEKHFTR